jgi:hypothetical protein
LGLFSSIALLDEVFFCFVVSSAEPPRSADESL